MVKIILILIEIKIILIIEVKKVLILILILIDISLVKNSEILNWSNYKKSYKFENIFTFIFNMAKGFNMTERVIYIFLFSYIYGQIKSISNLIFVQFFFKNDKFL